MPRFSQPIQACLKRTMLPRAPACFFSELDIQHITKETGLDPSTIIHWAEKLRWKIKNGMISYIDSYLNSIDENDSYLNSIDENDFLMSRFRQVHFIEVTAIK